jgi:hypothetical protein
MAMSWLFGSKTHSHQPDTTSLEHLKDRQVQSLYNHVKSASVTVVELKRHVEYRVDFAAGPQRFRLLIRLPPEFPRAKPIVKLDEPVTHQWVDQQMIIVGSPLLNEFKMHSVLGKVISEIVTEFQNNPPRPASTPYPTYQHPGPQQYLGSYPPPQRPYPGYPPQSRFPQPQPARPAPLTHASVQPPSSHPGEFSSMPRRPAPVPPLEKRQANLPVYNTPPIPEDFPELKHLPLDELEELHSKPERILGFIENLAVMKKLQDDRAELNGEIEQQARINLEKKPEIEEKVQKLTDQHEILTSVKRAFEGHQQQHRAACQVHKLFTFGNIRIDVNVHYRNFLMKWFSLV